MSNHPVAVRRLLQGITSCQGAISLNGFLAVFVMHTINNESNQEDNLRLDLMDLPSFKAGLLSLYNTCCASDGSDGFSTGTSGVNVFREIPRLLLVLGIKIS